MAIQTLDQLLASLGSDLRTNVYKASQTNVAGGYVSLWKSAGNPPAGVTPLAAGEAPTSATVGAIPFNNAASGKTQYLGRANFTAATAGTFFLYDRLWHNSGFSGIVTTAQTPTNPTTLTRYTDGNGVELFLEVNTALGATAATATASYTNQAGVSGRSATASITASLPANRMIRFILDVGDTGVQSVQSVTLSISTGTAGDFGLVFGRRLLEVPFSLANTGVVLDAFATGMPIVQDNACLAFFNQSTTTSSGVLIGAVDLVTG